MFETNGSLHLDSGEPVGREELEAIFDRLADALPALSELEADVAVDFETGKLEFFVVVEADNPMEAANRGNEIVRRALASADLVESNVLVELRTRQADLVTA